MVSLLIEKNPFDLQHNKNNKNNNKKYTHVFVLVSGELWIDGPFFKYIKLKINDSYHSFGK